MSKLVPAAGLNLLLTTPTHSPYFNKKTPLTHKFTCYMEGHMAYVHTAKMFVWCSRRGEYRKVVRKKESQYTERVDLFI